MSNMGGTIRGNIHLKWDNSNYGTYVVFGDRGSNRDYAYIGENEEDHMTLYGYKGVLVQAGGSGGVSGRLILESLVTAEDSGIDIACNGDSFLRLVSKGTNYGTVEITASHNIPIYTTNATAVVQLNDWSWNGGSWTHNAGAVTITTKNGNITLNPSNGNTEVYNFVNRSDIRDKDVVRNMEYDMSIFTKAPLFSFMWKEGSDRRVRIGTSAQYWMDYIPEVVSEITKYDKHGRLLDEHLSLDYITLCYAGVVTIARKVSDHETRIKELEEKLSI